MRQSKAVKVLGLAVSVTLVATATLALRPTDRERLAAFEQSTAGKDLELSTDERSYVLANLQRRDVSAAFAASERALEVRLTDETRLRFAVEYLTAERSLVDSGRVTQERVRAVAPAAVRAYLADIVGGTERVVGISSRLNDELKLGGALFYPERNRYGKVRVDVKPSDAEFVVTVDTDTFQSPRKPLIVREGSHAVRVTLPKTSCASTVVVEARKLAVLPCPK